jgi:hypothetical protein
MNGENEKCVRNLVEKFECKKPLGRPKSKWEDNIKTELTEIEPDGVDWIYLAQNMVHWLAVANMIMILRVP